MQLSFSGVRFHISDVMKCDICLFVRHSKLCPSAIQRKVKCITLGIASHGFWE